MTGPRLSIIPARAATDPALKPRDLQVLCVLGRHTDDLGWCRKSQVKMAAEMHCGRATVFEAIERLVKAGYLERHVQTSDNGRDSPHVYRIILDPKHPDPASVPLDACDGETAENVAATPAALAAPPAGIPAPPAGIPAPPAGSGPAPKNDPSGTIERDARETAEEGPSRDALRKIDADGWALLKNWPGFDGMPKEPALAIWRGLSAEDRGAARRRFLPWLELLRKQKKSHVPAPSTYLRERLWEAVADPADAPAPPVVAPPFGKVFGALRLAALIAGPGPIPPARGFLAEQIAAGGEAGERERLRRQAAHGWPEVNRMHEAAGNARGWTVRPGSAPPDAALEMMEQVSVGGERWLAWRALHEQRGWPWLPDPGRLGWVWMPAGGPDGLAEFERAMRGERQEAAE